MAHPVAASPQAQALAALIHATLAQTRPWPHRDSLVGIVPPPHPLPIALLTDTRLAPADKLAWWAIAQFSQTDHAVTPFPELAALARLVNVNSPKTVARALIMLRLTGWLTRARYRIDNAPARHLSLLHAAPLTWTDAVYLDPTLPAFVADMQRHSHAQVRKLAAAIAEQAAQFTGDVITAVPVCAGIEPDLPAVDRQNLPLPVQTEADQDEAQVKFSGPVDSTAPPAMDAGAGQADVPPRYRGQNLPPPLQPESASDSAKVEFAGLANSTAPPDSISARQILPSDTPFTDAMADGTAVMPPGGTVEEHPIHQQTVGIEAEGMCVAIGVHQAPHTMDAGPAQADVPAKHRRQNLPPPLPPESTSDGTNAKFTDPADSTAPPGSPSARQILPSDTSSADVNADGAAGMPPDRWDHENSTTRQPISGAGEGERAADEAGFSPSDVNVVTSDTGISIDQRGQDLPVRCSSSYIKQKTTTTPTNVASKICPSSPSALIYPARLTADMRQLIQAEVEKLSPSQRQAVLDELEGRFRAEQQGAPPVYDELRYLQRLCRLVKRGRFKRNLGLKVQHQREQRAQEEARRRQARSARIDDAQRRERQQARWRAGDNPLAEARRVLGMPDRKDTRDDEPDPA